LAVVPLAFLAEPVAFLAVVPVAFVAEPAVLFVALLALAVGAAAFLAGAGALAVPVAFLAAAVARSAAILAAAVAVSAAFFAAAAAVAAAFSAALGSGIIWRKAVAATSAKRVTRRSMSSRVARSRPAICWSISVFTASIQRSLFRRLRSTSSSIVACACSACTSPCFTRSRMSASARAWVMAENVMPASSSRRRRSSSAMEAEVTTECPHWQRAIARSGYVHDRCCRCGTTTRPSTARS
jgi:hypothetical protein